MPPPPIFADKGYEAGSVRLITQKAKANQAAIAYHFGGKEGLYREVLRAALHAFDEFSLIDEAGIDRIGPRRGAAPLSAPAAAAASASATSSAAALRIFNWEILQPTRELPRARRERAASGGRDRERHPRAFLPADAGAEERIVAMIWLVNQAYVFVRNYEYLSQPPTNLVVDADFVERLIELLARLLCSGLAGLMSENARPS